MNLRYFLIIAIIFAFSIPAPALSHDDIGMSPLEVRQDIEDVLMILDKHYVYPETAKAMRKFVNAKALGGDYADIQSRRELIEKLQTDLRSSSKDSHISLHLASDRQDRNNHRLPKTMVENEVHVDILARESDKPKIGYLRFNKFSGDAKTKRRIIEAMNRLNVTDSLIIDLRNNPGGDPNLSAFLSSYFLRENTHLWSIVDRNGDTLFRTDSADVGQYYSGELCILISDKTGSAAESFAYTLKHLKRATIIGQTSGGAAHLVQMERVNEQIDIRIPTARAYNPITKTNWEGVGVIPTMSVDASVAQQVAIQYLLKKDNVSTKLN